MFDFYPMFVSLVRLQHLSVPARIDQSHFERDANQFEQTATVNAATPAGSGADDSANLKKICLICIPGLGTPVEDIRFLFGPRTFRVWGDLP